MLINMENKDAHVIKFGIVPNLDPYREVVYMSDEAYKNLPIGHWGIHDTESIIPEYFTKEKIEEYKKRLCEQIMNSENPFNIYVNDWDCYPVDEDKIWK